MSDRIFSSCKTNIKINRSWENQATLKILDVFPIGIQRLCLGGNHWHFKCKSRYRDNRCQSCRPKLGSPCRKRRKFFYRRIKSAYLALISLSNYAFAYWIHSRQIICLRKQSAIVNMLLESGAPSADPALPLSGMSLCLSFPLLTLPPLFDHHFILETFTVFGLMQWGLDLVSGF